MQNKEAKITREPEIIEKSTAYYIRYLTLPEGWYEIKKHKVNNWAVGVVAFVIIRLFVYLYKVVSHKVCN